MTQQLIPQQIIPPVLTCKPSAFAPSGASFISPPPPMTHKPIITDNNGKLISILSPEKITIRKAADGDYAKLLLPLINKSAYGWEAKDENRPQVSRAHLNEDYTIRFTLNERKFHSHPETLPAPVLPKIMKLNRKRLMNHNSGKETLRFRSKFIAGGFMILRPDVDAHRPDQTDSVAVKVHVDGLLGGVPYWSGSPRGFSGGLLVRIPTYKKEIFNPQTGEVTIELRPLTTRKKMNQLSDDLDHALGAIVRNAGFKAGAEVQGGFLITQTETDPETGMMLSPTKVTGGMAGRYCCKPPTCPTPEDVMKLKGAVMEMDDPRLLHILKVGLPLWEAEQAAMKAAKLKPKTSTPGSAPTPKRIIVDGDQKLADLRDAIKTALTTLCVKTKVEFVTRKDEIKDVANLNYIAMGHDDYRDEKRDRDLTGTFHFILAGFDETKIGGLDRPRSTQQVMGYFTDENLANLQSYLQHIIGTQKYEAARTWLRYKKQSQITWERLAIVGATLAKNVANSKNGGRVGVSSVDGMLQHFGHNLSRSTIAVMVNLLQSYQICATNGYYIPKVQSRKWEINQWHLFPFTQMGAEALEVLEGEVLDEAAILRDNMELERVHLAAAKMEMVHNRSLRRIKEVVMARARRANRGSQYNMDDPAKVSMGAGHNTPSSFFSFYIIPCNEEDSGMENSGCDRAQKENRRFFANISETRPKAA